MRCYFSFNVIFILIVCLCRYFESLEEDKLKGFCVIQNITLPFHLHTYCINKFPFARLNFSQKRRNILTLLHCATHTRTRIYLFFPPSLHITIKCFCRKNTCGFYANKSVLKPISMLSSLPQFLVIIIILYFSTVRLT